MVRPKSTLDPPVPMKRRYGNGKRAEAVTEGDVDEDEAQVLVFLIPYSTRTAFEEKHGGNEEFQRAVASRIYLSRPTPLNFVALFFCARNPQCLCSAGSNGLPPAPWS
jgi:hypothetical protein